MIPPFTTSEASIITGVPPQTLHYWDTAGIISPSVAKAHGTGSRRLYSFHDVLAVRVVRLLREDGGITAAVRKAAEYVQRRGEVEKDCWLFVFSEDVEPATPAEMLTVLRLPNRPAVFRIVNLSGVAMALRVDLETMEHQGKATP